jgi:hypothetical protein
MIGRNESEGKGEVGLMIALSRILTGAHLAPFINPIFKHAFRNSKANDLIGGSLPNRDWKIPVHGRLTTVRSEPNNSSTRCPRSSRTLYKWKNFRIGPSFHLGAIVSLAFCFSDRVNSLHTKLLDIPFPVPKKDQIEPIVRTR